MNPTIHQQLAQAKIAELHRQAGRARLVHAARHGRRTRRHQPRQLLPVLQSALTRQVLAILGTATTDRLPPSLLRWPSTNRPFNPATTSEVIMNRILAALATLAGALVAATAAAPAALAVHVPPPGGAGAALTAPPQVHTVVIGGMPGWQITLIAAGAALTGAALAVLLDRARAARKAHPTTA
jgi:hypothetical protein